MEWHGDVLPSFLQDMHSGCSHVARDSPDMLPGLTCYVAKRRCCPALQACVIEAVPRFEITV